MITPELIRAAEVINTGIARPAPLNARFDANVIAPHVSLAMLNSVLPVVCEDMYADMLPLMNAANCNYNSAAGADVAKFPSDANYESLWRAGGLYQLAAAAVVLEALPFITLQINTQAVMEFSGNHGANTGLANTKYLMGHLRANVQRLQKKVTEYIHANKGLFPEYSCPIESCSCKDTTQWTGSAAYKLGVVI